MTTQAVKERPIIFSGAMVRAILAGTKTQMRRIIKINAQTILSPGQRKSGFTFNPDFARVGDVGRLIAGLAGATKPPPIEQQLSIAVRIHAPWSFGDHLWVRENWQVWTEFNGVKIEDLPAKARENVNYPAGGNVWDAKIRPSIHMPRWASRLTMEVTGVRVERLNQISEEDAAAEGLSTTTIPPGYVVITDAGGMSEIGENFVGGIPSVGDNWCGQIVTHVQRRPSYQLSSARQNFEMLWESIHGKETWALNPWVWVLSFKKADATGRAE